MDIFTPASGIDYVSDGEPIDAVTANRCIRELASNTDYLLELFRRLRSRQAIILTDQLLDASVKLGQVVYYDLVNSCYAPASAEFIQEYSALRVAKSGYCWGVVCAINNGVGDILVNGMAEIDMTEAIDGTPTPGLHYLSATKPGYLVLEEPPVSLPVAFLYTRIRDNIFEVFVNVRFNDLLRSHKHYKLDLPTVPAGTTAANSGTISTANPSIIGWLPASHSSFGGLAPAGAKYGYNLQAAGLKESWPPVPIQLMMLELAVAAETPDNPPRYGGVTEDYCEVDGNGIWWMSDAVPMLPWDGTRAYTQGVATTTVPYEQYLRLWFTKLDLDTENGYVSSLTGDSNTGVKVTQKGTGIEASTGDLMVSFDLNLVMGETDDISPVAVKSVTDNKLNTGPVVTGLRIDGTDLVISEMEAITDGYASGRVVLQSLDSFNGRELLIESVHLQNAQTTLIAGISGITFPANRKTALIGRVSVPDYVINPNNPAFKIRLGILVQTPGTIPDNALTFKVQTVPNVTALQTTVDLNTSLTPIAANVGTTISPSGLWPKVYYVESSLQSFNIGDSLFITIERPGIDSYSGDITLVRQSIILREQ